jgi:hypothetical protein
MTEKEITPCLKTANDYIVYLCEEIKKKDKDLRDEEATSNELHRLFKAERAERISQEKKSGVALFIMIFAVFGNALNIVLSYLF